MYIITHSRHQSPLGHSTKPLPQVLLQAFSHMPILCFLKALGTDWYQCGLAEGW